MSLSHRCPRQIIAGDSIEFLVAVPSDYQSWTRSARLTGPSQMDASSVVLAGADFHVKFNGQGTTGSGTYATRQLIAGQYTLTVWAKNAATNDRKTIAQCQLTIAPDLSSATPAEPHCVVMLRAIEKALIARVTGNGDGGLESYQIDGTSITKVSLELLERKRRQYAAEVAALQSPNGQIGRVKFAFTPAGGIVDQRRRFG